MSDQRFEAAKAAMRVLMARPDTVDDCVIVALRAVAFADSLLARLKETEPVRLHCGADAHIIYPPDTVCECGLVRRMQP